MHVISAAIADKADVYRATKPAAALWEDIGLALKIHPTELEKIKHDISGADDRLKQVLSLWLTGNGGECSWRFLCAAMRDDLVARPNLAKTLRNNTYNSHFLKILNYLINLILA